MQLFHILTFIISITIFIGLFIYSVSIFYDKKTYFPPDIPDCPDYWKVNEDGTCQIPKPGELNLGNLAEKGRQIYTYSNFTDKSVTYSFLPSYYDPIFPKMMFGKKTADLPLGYYQIDIPYGYDQEKPQNGTIDFNDNGWASHGDPYCEMKKWASQHNVQWDGMANYNKC